MGHGSTFSLVCAYAPWGCSGKGQERQGKIHEQVLGGLARDGERALPKKKADSDWSSNRVAIYHTQQSNWNMHNPHLRKSAQGGIANWIKRKKTLGVFVNLHIVVPWFYTNSHHFIHGFMVNFWASRRQDSYAPPPRSKGYSSGSLAVSFLNLRWFIDIFRYAKTGIECKRMTWRMRFADICVYSFCFIWISKLVHFYEQMCFLGSPTKPFPTS